MSDKSSKPTNQDRKVVWVVNHVSVGATEKWATVLYTSVSAFERRETKTDTNLIALAAFLYFTVWENKAFKSGFYIIIRVVSVV